MNNKPLNRLSKDFMTEMISTLDKLENDSSCRGVILTSVSASAIDTGTVISVNIWGDDNQKSVQINL